MHFPKCFTMNYFKHAWYLCSVSMNVCAHMLMFTTITFTRRGSHCMGNGTHRFPVHTLYFLTCAKYTMKNTSVYLYIGAK